MLQYPRIDAGLKGIQRAVQLNLRVTEGGWGDIPLDQTEALARSVIETFSSGLRRDLRVDVVLERRASPMAVSSWLSEHDEYIIHIGCDAILMNQFAYQLAHEFAHVIADSLSFRVDRFAWLEESICEAGSLFALRSLASAWRTAPPRSWWQSYHAQFAQYAGDRLDHQQHSLGESVDFKGWLAANLPSLAADHTQREHNTIIARNLLPIFEMAPTAWSAVEQLHRFERPLGMDLVSFLKSWRGACPTESKRTVDQVADVLGVSFPAPRSRQRTRQATALQYLGAVRAAVSRPAPKLQVTSDPTRPAPETKRSGSSTE